MVMIDDSLSMGAAGPLALQALTILTTALRRLEVGRVCLASFAENIRILHSFDEPLTEASGAMAMSAFSFKATQTRLASALRAVLPVLEEARLSAANGDETIQICFIISDARMDSDNRVELQSLVRTMTEDRILPVLIIIDQNEDGKDSIFNTRSVEFTNAGIVTKAYLDDFPFPYYLTISNLEKLPEILSDALRQWFSIIR